MGISPDRYQPKWDGSPDTMGRALETAGSDIGNRFSQGFNSLIGGIGDAIRGVGSSTFSPISKAMKPIRDGQQALSSQIELLSALLDYGSAFVPVEAKIKRSEIIPFTQQLGPMRGVRLKGNGLELVEPGLWDIRTSVTRASVYDDGTYYGEVYCDVYVKRPDGSTYSVQSGHIKSVGTTTITVITSVVVPEANYYVEVFGGVKGLRRVIGGPQWSRLTVQRISDRVVGNWRTGSEGSEPEVEE